MERRPPSVTERYYSLRYCTDVNGHQHGDQCILFHSNRICVVTVARSHPIVALHKKVARVDFQVSDQLNRLNNKVSGKGKRGGQWLKESSPLCVVHCEDGARYTLFSCVSGKLVEANENLLDNPQLLESKPGAEGYVAIVLPTFGKSETQKSALLTPEEYTAEMARRRPQIVSDDGLSLESDRL